MADEKMSAAQDAELSALLAQARQHTKANQHAQAAQVCRVALRLAPRRAEAHVALGRSLLNLEQFDAALAAFTLALQLQPDLPGAHALKGETLICLGQVEEALGAYRRAIELEPASVALHNCLIFPLHYLDDAEAIREEQHRWVEQHAAPFLAQREEHLNVRDPERPLKVGYVSNDFYEHAAAHVCLPLLAHHDRSRFQIFAYSTAKRPDAMTERFRRAAHVWRESAGQDDAALAQTIRRDGIDILVDLEMHMDGSRLLVFARRPAPVQVTWAFPGGTGLPAIDYRVSDRHLDPALENDDYYAEKTVRLPDCFWCYDPMTEGPPVNPLPALTTGHVTFGCFNNFAKVNEATLALWARVLRAVETSRMIILVPDGSPRARVRAAFARLGIAPEGVEFISKRKREAYLATHHQVDVMLDPFPYGGHVTQCDGLWMGVPAVTLTGKTAASRVGLSQLSSVGLAQFAATTADDYVRIAVETAGDLAGLAALRAGLRERMKASPLMNGPRFAANMEVAYRDMWRRWCAEAQR